MMMILYTTVRFRSRLFTLVIVIVMFVIGSVVVAAASTTGAATSGYSNSRYNPYLYDKTVPQFTPDGRLLQVEYASRASDHSSPIVVATITNDITMICTVRGSTKKDNNNYQRQRIRQQQQKIEQQEQQKKRSYNNKNNNVKENDSYYNDDDDDYNNSNNYNNDDTTTPSIIQQRLIVLDGTNTNTNRPTDVDTGTSSPQTVVLGLSGVLADSFALLQFIQNERLYTSRWYNGGGDSVLSPYRIANTIGTQCHIHSMGGGIRPYGSTVLILGLIQNNNKKVTKSYRSDSNPSSSTSSSSSCTTTIIETMNDSNFVLYKTDPSGGVQKLNLHYNDPTTRIVVTGGGEIGIQLEQRLRSSTELFLSASDIITGSTTTSNVQKEQEQKQDQDQQLQVRSTTPTPNNDDDKISKNKMNSKMTDGDDDDDNKIPITTDDTSSEFGDGIVRKRIANLLSIIIDEHQKSTKFGPVQPVPILEGGNNKRRMPGSTDADENKEMYVSDYRKDDMNDIDKDDTYYYYDYYPYVTELMLFSKSRGVVQLSPRFIQKLLQTTTTTTKGPIPPAASIHR